MGKKAKGKPKAPSKLYSNYEVAGDSLKRKNLTCPKCGPAIFLGKHKNRVACGKCGYTEFFKQEKE